MLTTFSHTFARLYFHYHLIQNIICFNCGFFSSTWVSWNELLSCRHLGVPITSQADFLHVPLGSKMRLCYFTL